LYALAARKEKRHLVASNFAGEKSGTTLFYFFAMNKPGPIEQSRSAEWRGL